MKIKTIGVWTGGICAAMALAACTQPKSHCAVQASDFDAPFYAKYTFTQLDDANSGGCAFFGAHKENGKTVSAEELAVSLFGQEPNYTLGIEPASLAQAQAAPNSKLVALGAFNNDPTVCQAPTLEPISAIIVDPNSNFPAAFPRLLGFDGGCAIFDDGGIGFADGGLGCVPMPSSSSASGSSSSASASSSGSSGSVSSSGSGGSVSGSSSGSSGSASSGGSGSASGSSSGSGGSTSGSGSGSTSASSSTSSSSSTGSSGSTSTTGSDLDAGGTAVDAGPAGPPRVQVTYTFSNVKFVQAANIPGTEFSADLIYNQSPIDPGGTVCHATMHVDAVWYSDNNTNAWADGGSPPDIFVKLADGGSLDRGFIGNHCDSDSDCQSPLFSLPGGGSDFECLQPAHSVAATLACTKGQNMCGAPGNCIVTDADAGTGYCGETMWDGGVGNPGRCVPKSTVPAGADACTVNCGP